MRTSFKSKYYDFNKLYNKLLKESKVNELAVFKKNALRFGKTKFESFFDNITKYGKFENALYKSDGRLQLVLDYERILLNLIDIIADQSYVYYHKNNSKFNTLSIDNKWTYQNQINNTIRFLNSLIFALTEKRDSSFSNMLFIRKEAIDFHKQNLAAIEKAKKLYGRPLSPKKKIIYNKIDEYYQDLINNSTSKIGKYREAVKLYWEEEYNFYPINDEDIKLYRSYKKYKKNHS